MDKVWWESVPNALRLENSIIEYLESGKQIVFMYSEYIPWPDTFREQIEILQRQNITGYGIDYIKDEEDEEPGYQILNKYCKKEIKDDYRPAIGYARFLANLDSITLNSSIVWIKTYSESRIKLWCDFISDYRHDLKKESDGGMFIRKNISTAQMFEQFYGKPFSKIDTADLGCAEEIDWGEDVGGEII